jgi:hypothetical protein
MDHDHPSDETRHSSPGRNWILIGFLLVAGYFLVMEHRAHLEGALAYLPYLLLLACPLMHLFMHHDHGGHGGHPSQKDDQGEQK